MEEKAKKWTQLGAEGMLTKAIKFNKKNQSELLTTVMQMTYSISSG